MRTNVHTFVRNMEDYNMAVSNTEKDKALDAALLQIQKQFGKGAIMKLGDDNALTDIQAISTGSITLDVATGIGGVPRGRIIEIYGPESSGKTTLTLHIIAEAQKTGGKAAFIDAEHALDPEYAKHLGVDVNELLVSQPDTGEQALEICEMLVRSGALDVIVIDSVALVGFLMFGNLLRECGVLGTLSETAQNALANLITLLLGITISFSMQAEAFVTLDTLLIMVIGLFAFVFDTIGGVVFAKLINLFLKKKVNPMIGAAGISAFPMSSRVVQKLALSEDPSNVLIMQAAGANVSGQIASVIAGGLVINLISSYL